MTIFKFFNFRSQTRLWKTWSMTISKCLNCHSLQNLDYKLLLLYFSKHSVQKTMHNNNTQVKLHCTQTPIISCMEITNSKCIGSILLGFVWSAEGPVWEDGVLPVCFTQSKLSPVWIFFQLHCSVLLNVQISVSEKINKQKSLRFKYRKNKIISKETKYPLYHWQLIWFRPNPFQLCFLQYICRFQHWTRMHSL